MLVVNKIITDQPDYILFKRLTHGVYELVKLNNCGYEELDRIVEHFSENDVVDGE